MYGGAKAVQKCSPMSLLLMEQVGCRRGSSGDGKVAAQVKGNPSERDMRERAGGERGG